MKNQLKIYDSIDYVVQEHRKQEWFKSFKRNYFLSDIMRVLNINDELEIKVSLNRAFAACIVLQISKHQNFEKIYRFDGENLHVDWKISSLACYLVIVNSNPENEFAARAQLHFAINRYR